jgi:hypothetical protein
MFGGVDFFGLLLICLGAYASGLVGSITGGGGLISLPIMMLVMVQTPIVTILGTNKLIAFFGTSFAIYRYSRNISIPWKTVLPLAVFSFLGSLAGAQVVSLMKPEGLRPVIIVVLAFVAIYTFSQKNLGTHPTPGITGWNKSFAGIIAGVVLGFYDGFLGPGTGTFFIFSLVLIYGLDFLSSAASAKVLNAATNLAAILFFAFTNQLDYVLGIPMILCNILGAITGTKLAMLKGNRFIRNVFICMVILVLLKLSYDTFRG